MFCVRHAAQLSQINCTCSVIIQMQQAFTLPANIERNGCKVYSQLPPAPASREHRIITTLSVLPVVLL